MDAGGPITEARVHEPPVPAPRESGAAALDQYGQRELVPVRPDVEDAHTFAREDKVVKRRVRNSLPAQQIAPTNQDLRLVADGTPRASASFWFTRS
jgi:hypothetical protein